MNEQILEMLMQGTVEVIFRKKENNLLRTMLCTMMKSYIPPEEVKTYTRALAESSGDRMIVWDVEKNDWRSFYLNTIVDVFQSNIKKQLHIVTEREVSHGKVQKKSH